MHSAFSFRRGAFIFLLLFVLFFTYVPSVFAEESNFAAEYTGEASVEAASVQAASQLFTDGNRRTHSALPGGEILTFTYEEPVSQLYLVWDIAPASYRIISGGQTQTFAEEANFIHQYVQLSVPCEKITLQVQDDRGILCDVYAFGAGETPGWVQKWQQPWERADLLCLPTHADDEHLFFGGTMPFYAAERGLRVQVAYLANHNGEPYRPHELLNGLWTVGIRAYPVISEFPDRYVEDLEQAKTVYDEEAVKAYQTALIRRFKPYVAVGHDLNGEYGHGMHCLNAVCLLDIAGKTGDASFCPESAERYGTWELPKLYLHLYPENEIKMDWDVPLTAFGGKTAYEVACEGYACHASQQSGFQMGRHGYMDNTRFGLAHTTVGPDEAGNDFFEHIVFEEEAPPAEEPADETESAASSCISCEDVSSAADGSSSSVSTPVQSAKSGVALFVLLAAALVLLLVFFIRRSKHRP